jgi:hypothetical protein
MFGMLAGLKQHVVMLPCFFQREAQKTKWMVDMVMKVDGEYAGELAEQRALVVSHHQGMNAAALALQLSALLLSQLMAPSAAACIHSAIGASMVHTTDADAGHA